LKANVLNAKLALGPQLHQLNAQLVLKVNPPLLVQFLLMPVLLVPILDVLLVLMLAQTNVRLVVQATI